MASSITETTVLIVGAGPAGMACALSLWYNGVKDVVIVDAVQLSEHTSRAMVIHAATLEALSDIECADALTEVAIKASSARLYDPTSHLFTADFSTLGKHTRFPYFLLLQQDVTEQKLADKLVEKGIHVLRPLRMVGMRDAEKDGASIVLFDDGSRIQAKYVIGADGSHSVVREAAGIAFQDPDGQTLSEKDIDQTIGQMVIADIVFSSPPNLPARDTLFSTTSAEGFFVVAPLPTFPGKDGKPSRQTYRIASGIPLSMGTPPSSPPASYLQDLVDKFGPSYISSDPSINPNAVHVKEAVWSTRFRTRSAAAEQFFKRLGSAICLIGDAAHIHPPVGGQGMNLGLRDAVALGPAVAAHLAEPDVHGADDKLAVHAAARRQSALAVIAAVKGLMGRLGRGRADGWLSLRMRSWMIWGFGRFSYFGHVMAWRLSGLGMK